MQMEIDANYSVKFKFKVHKDNLLFDWISNSNVGGICIFCYSWEKKSSREYWET